MPRERVSPPVNRWAGRSLAARDADGIPDRRPQREGLERDLRVTAFAGRISSAGAARRSTGLLIAVSPGATQQHDTAVERAKRDFGGIALHAVIIRPLAGVQSAFDVHLVAFAHILLDDFGEVLVVMLNCKSLRQPTGGANLPGVNL